MNKIQINNIKILYNKNIVTIKDSYRVTKKDDMLKILIAFRIKARYKSKRSYESWLKEWRTHNLLYKLGLFKKHTKDCDLEETEKIYRLIIYEILGRL